MPTAPVRKITNKLLAGMGEWLTYSGSVVYFVGPRRGELVKIGFAANLASRLRHLQTGSPVKLEVLAVALGGVDLERDYHRRFAVHRERGEWFRRAPEVKAEMSRLQGISPPPKPAPSEEELTQRKANILAYCRQQKLRLLEIG